MGLVIAKLVHVACVVATFAGFVLRGVWMALDSPALGKTWVRVAPHIIDTLLLLSALALMFGIQQYPGSHGWLTAKVTGLVAYILLGMVALKWGPSKRIRLAAWVMALLVFAYVVMVAVTHSASLGLAG